MIRGLVRDKTTGQGDVDVHVVGGGVCERTCYKTVRRVIATAILYATCEEKLGLGEFTVKKTFICE